MKSYLIPSLAAGLCALAGPAAADIVYSELVDSAIPLDFTGLFVDVDNDGNWDLNPFFGGVAVANTAAFQPARIGTGNLDALQAFSAGDLIGSDIVLSSGYGGSQTHLGTTITAGQESYLGFQIGSNYGWMRVEFTANTEGAVIKDWAYDNSGNAIEAGTTERITWSSADGEDREIGSQQSGWAGKTSVSKTGAGTTTLKGSHNLSGDTTVHGGRLVIDGDLNTNSLRVKNGGLLDVKRTRSISTSGVVVEGGGRLVLNGNISTSLASIEAGGTLGGSGSITGDITIAGNHAPGESPGEQTIDGNLTYESSSTITWELAANSTGGRGTDWDAINVTGDLTITGTTSLYLDFNPLASGAFGGSVVNFTDTFWDAPLGVDGGGWRIFDVAGTITGFENLDLVSENWLDSQGQSFTALHSDQAFTLYDYNNGIYLTTVAVPEISATSSLAVALAGGLMLRRRGPQPGSPRN